MEIHFRTVYAIGRIEFQAALGLKSHSLAGVILSFQLLSVFLDT